MIAICSDHAGFELKSIIEGYLEADNKEYKDFGTNGPESCDYPDFAHPCAQAVEAGEWYPGIAMCGSGNGIAMTLNKHQGIRAALCWTPELARLARQHNDANVLVMGARVIGPGLACQITDTWLDTPFSEEDRHINRLKKLEANVSE